MNVHDSSRMEEVLGLVGYARAGSPETSDLIIVNTCSVREKSHEKVLSALGRYGRLKQAHPGLILAVAGCVAQQEGARLLERVPALDLVFSPDHIAALPELVEQAGERRRVETGFAEPDEYQFLSARPGRVAGPTALVTIQKGCDNNCAYCIVPSVRGPCVSRPRDEILEELDRLTAAGVREVTLIGQNVNAYRGSAGTADDFVELLRAVDQRWGGRELARLRFTTSHPKDFHPELPGCFRDLACLCPWLHLPVQSGSSRVLEAMSRGYTREQYLVQLRAVRAAYPDVSMGTDLIVGFPGETEADFLETIELLEEAQYDYAYSFKFSPRPGTAAAGLRDELPEEEKARRLKHLQQVQDGITSQRLRSLVGRSTEVLIEGPSRKGKPQLCGRDPGNHVINIDDPEGRFAPGDLVPVEIVAAGRHSLSATPIPRQLEVMQCSSR